MSALPVITALGGVSPAGRTACHHGFNRLIFDALDEAGQARTLRALRSLDITGRYADDVALLDGSLVRRLEAPLLDPDRIAISVSASQGLSLIHI